MFDQELVQEFFEEIYRITRKTNSFSSVSRKFGDFEEPYSYYEAQIMFNVALNGEKGNAFLAEALQISPGAISQIIKKMIIKGYIEKKHDALNDGRRIQYKLTEKGNAALEGYNQYGQEVLEYFNVAFKDFTKEDVETFIRVASIFSSFNYLTGEGIDRPQNKQVD